MSGQYECGNCHRRVSPSDHYCPHCRVYLGGVKCSSCGYVGGTDDFRNNNDRCPKCAKAIGNASLSGCVIDIAKLGLILLALAAVLSLYVVVTALFAGEWSIRGAFFFAIGAVIGVVISETFLPEEQKRLRSFIIFLSGIGLISVVNFFQWP